jgi:hypothetical protein
MHQNHHSPSSNYIHFCILIRWLNPAKEQISSLIISVAFVKPSWYPTKYFIIQHNHFQFSLNLLFKINFLQLGSLDSTNKNYQTHTLLITEMKKHLTTCTKQVVPPSLPASCDEETPSWSKTSQGMLQLGEDQHVGTADLENESHQVWLQTGPLFHDTAYGKHELQLLKQSLNIGHPELSSSGKTIKYKAYTNVHKC